MMSSNVPSLAANRLCSVSEDMTELRKEKMRERQILSRGILSFNVMGTAVLRFWKVSLCRSSKGSFGSLRARLTTRSHFADTNR